MDNIELKEKLVINIMIKLYNLINKKIFLCKQIYRIYLLNGFVNNKILIELFKQKNVINIILLYYLRVKINNLN